jgi:hypothetical protein
MLLYFEWQRDRNCACGFFASVCWEQFDDSCRHEATPKDADHIGNSQINVAEKNHCVENYYLKYDCIKMFTISLIGF